MQTTKLFGIGLSIILMVSACKSELKEERISKPFKVRTLKINKSNYVIPVRCAGKLSTKTESKLSFKTGGIIKRILVDEGQSVKKDQLLAELNPEEIHSQVQQSELALNKSERDFQRIENLYHDSVATLEQYENSRTALDFAKTNKRIAGFNLQYSSIHAPSDGKILKRIAETDEMIAPGYPVFIFASSHSEWIIRANLADRDVIRVHMLDSAEILFDAFPDKVFMGLISEIGSSADPYTGTYEVEIQLLGRPERLVSGFISRVEIYPYGDESKILIPYESIVDGAGLTGYVYVISNGEPRRRKLQIEAFTDMGIVVKQGLIEGEEIVVEGTQYLRDGSRIEIIESAK